MKTILTVILLLLMSYSFGQSNLSNAEYFIDTDPGYGNATSIDLTTNPAIIDEIILNDLPIGVHWFYLRAQDENGIWGFAEAFPFKIIIPIDPIPISNLSQAEYFFGDDPGFGEANQITVSSNDTIEISEFVSSAGLENGINKLSLRFKNENDIWGISQSVIFYVRKSQLIGEEKIIGMEYFIDEDPGIGSGIYHPQSVADTVLINEWLETQALSDGIHKLGIRVQSDSGTWSLREWTEFEYLNCIGDPVMVSGEDEFCEESTVSLSLPESYDSYYWNTHENSSLIETGLGGEYFGVVYDSLLNICSLSDTLLLQMFTQPDPYFTYITSFNTIEAFANADGQNLFWQINDEFNSIEEEIIFELSNDGWQYICLEASNVCGSVTLCDSVLTCGEYETPPYWYVDFDGDGFGTQNDSIKACEIPLGYSDNTLDCDDNDESIFPGATEIPNDGIDQDCDGADLVTGINDISTVISSISPNPANDFVEITFQQSYSGIINLLNTAGQVILQGKIDNNDLYRLNLKSTPAGLYFIQFTNEYYSITKRFIIE